MAALHGRTAPVAVTRTITGGTLSDHRRMNNGPGGYPASTDRTNRHFGADWLTQPNVVASFV
jgi:hypothetical protein